MAVVMILCGDAHGRPTRYDGQYLRDFDFEAHDGIGMISTTADLQRAKHFDDMQEAFAFYKRSPVCRPIRVDGRPNRPLTSTNWEFRTI